MARQLGPQEKNPAAAGFQPYWSPVTGRRSLLSGRDRILLRDALFRLGRLGGSG